MRVTIQVAPYCLRTVGMRNPSNKVWRGTHSLARADAISCHLQIPPAVLDTASHHGSLPQEGAQALDGAPLPGEWLVDDGPEAANIPAVNQILDFDGEVATIEDDGAVGGYGQGCGSGEGGGKEMEEDVENRTPDRNGDMAQGAELSVGFHGRASDVHADGEGGVSGGDAYDSEGGMSGDELSDFEDGFQDMDTDYEDEGSEFDDTEDEDGWDSEDGGEDESMASMEQMLEARDPYRNK